MAPPIATLVNMSIQQCLFPNCLKNAELSPVFKKDDSMNKTNFRPVSILVCFSKIFEKLYCDQLLDFFNKVLSKFLSAFHKGYSCETVLIKWQWQWQWKYVYCQSCTKKKKWLKIGENVYWNTRLLLQCLSIWARRLTACHTRLIG